MPDPDDVASTLAAIKERAKEAAAMDVDVLAAFSGISVGGVIAASAVDVPVLLAALEAVLKLHSRWEIRDGDDGEGEFERAVCRHCCAADGGGQTEDCAVIHMADECWPCDTYRAITATLGEEAGDGTSSA